MYKISELKSGDINKKKTPLIYILLFIYNFIY